MLGVECCMNDWVTTGRCDEPHCDSGQRRKLLGLPGLETFRVSACPLTIVLIPLCPSPFRFLHQREMRAQGACFGWSRTCIWTHSRAPHLHGPQVGNSAPHHSLSEAPACWESSKTMQEIRDSQRVPTALWVGAAPVCTVLGHHPLPRHPQTRAICEK